MVSELWWPTFLSEFDSLWVPCIKLRKTSIEKYVCQRVMYLCNVPEREKEKERERERESRLCFIAYQPL